MLLIVIIQNILLLSLSQVSVQEPYQVSVFGDEFPEVKPNQVIVQRHLYVACVDTEARQPAWVAYRVNRRDWDTDNKLERNFSTPKELRPICLEQSDYKGSKYQLGHLYGLQFVSARADGNEVNQLCAVAAQRQALNTGVWLQAENKVRAASESSTVTVMTGLLWIDPMPPLKNANETHKVASHFWIIFTADGITESYLMPQSARQGDKLSEYTIELIKLKSQVSDKWSRGIR